MDRKGSRANPTRPSRKRKRSFHGNRYNKEEDTNYTSTSAKKLIDSEDTDVSIQRDHSYCIINFIAVFSAISSYVCCKECKKDVKFNEKSIRGLGCKICIKCDCGEKDINTCPVIDKAYEINRRIVFVMRLLGIGLQGINLFCGLMDIGKGLSISTYYACLENLRNASQAVYELSIKAAVKKEKELTEAANENPQHLSVSGDGTWKKRGFTSLFGVTTLIGKYSSKVIDTVVRSSFCRACSFWSDQKDTLEYEEWYDNHQGTCFINHVGSAGKMEVDAIKEMFLKSMEKYGVKYTTYIGDGDSKTFKAILDINPYGDNIPVKKKECVGHVEKRMGTRLRATKKNNKGLGGKGTGKLTAKMISDLTTYYGLAIRRNTHDLEEMKKAVWTTFLHKSSTDDKPQHHYCPPGPESWCKWRQAETNGTLETFTHDPPLDKKVLECIKPIYEDLSSNNLLERCLGAHTQNNNESLNSLIWTFAPKHIFAGKGVVDIANFLAVNIFNDGFINILKIMEVMGITIGSAAYDFAVSRNNVRLKRSEHRASSSSKEARIAAREHRTLQNAIYEEEEGSLYGPGIAD